MPMSSKDMLKLLNESAVAMGLNFSQVLQEALMEKIKIK